jgi:GTP-binding protein
VVLIIDANVGPTQTDLETLYSLEDKGKNVVVVANKIDKIKKSEYEKKWKEVEELIGQHKIVPYSAKTKEGKEELIGEIFN